MDWVVAEGRPIFPPSEKHTTDAKAPSSASTPSTSNSHDSGEPILEGAGVHSGCLPR